MVVACNMGCTVKRKNKMVALPYAGGAQESRPAVLPLPEESTQRVTGEEEERSVFSGE